VSGDGHTVAVRLLNRGVSHRGGQVAKLTGAELFCAARNRDHRRKGNSMTLVWFVVWLVANVWGDDEPLQFDPVNWWAGTLILAAALDLGRQHVPERQGTT
jgi:hypothetical protein